ncbi:hypothetical protein JTE90_010368 [Oedothorax gibbosus]|uniref:Uncharacterized protein n=1 Tax=Oedothorax gibbosus TaxID=931172 RepID=A0AAV6W235_9ARAC|nr:hypothetical protein JTE90_010368 [Oedothorax gibbosus]
MVRCQPDVPKDIRWTFCGCSWDIDVQRIAPGGTVKEPDCEDYTLQARFSLGFGEGHQQPLKSLATHGCDPLSRLIPGKSAFISHPYLLSLIRTLDGSPYCLVGMLTVLVFLPPLDHSHGGLDDG